MVFNFFGSPQTKPEKSQIVMQKLGILMLGSRKWQQIRSSAEEARRQSANAFHHRGDATLTRPHNFLNCRLRGEK